MFDESGGQRYEKDRPDIAARVRRGGGSITAPSILNTHRPSFGAVAFAVDRAARPAVLALAARRAVLAVSALGTRFVAPVFHKIFFLIIPNGTLHFSIHVHDTKMTARETGCNT